MFPRLDFLQPYGFHSSEMGRGGLKKLRNFVHRNCQRSSKSRGFKRLTEQKRRSYAKLRTISPYTHAHIHDNTGVACVAVRISSLFFNLFKYLRVTNKATAQLRLAEGVADRAFARNSMNKIMGLYS